LISLCYFFHVRYSNLDLIFEIFHTPHDVNTYVEKNFLIFEIWRIFIILFFTYKIPKWLCNLYDFIGDIGIKTRILKMFTLFCCLLINLIVLYSLISYNIDKRIGNDFGLLFNDLCMFIISTLTGWICLCIIGIFIWIKNGYVNDKS